MRQQTSDVALQQVWNLCPLGLGQCGARIWDSGCIWDSGWGAGAGLALGDVAARVGGK